MNGKTIEAIARGSDNLRSLILTFDAALYTRAGGMYPGSMPVLMMTNGQYRDLVANDLVEVEWT